MKNWLNKLFNPVIPTERICYPTRKIWVLTITLNDGSTERYKNSSENTPVDYITIVSWFAHADPNYSVHMMPLEDAGVVVYRHDNIRSIRYSQLEEIYGDH